MRVNMAEKHFRLFKSDERPIGEFDAVGYTVLKESLGETQYMREHPQYLKERREMLRSCRNLCLDLRHIQYDWDANVDKGFGKRVGLARAIAMLRFGEGRRLLIYDLGTLQLGEIEIALLMTACRDWSIEVWEAISEKDLTKAVDRWQKVLQSCDEEIVKAAAREFSAMKRQATRLHTGSRAGQIPFGDRPDENEILKRIWKLRRVMSDGSGRRSYEAIANELNETGVKPRRGKKWYAATVRRIVRRTKPHLDK
jgi:hypothetical protein